MMEIIGWGKVLPLQLLPVRPARQALPVRVRQVQLRLAPVQLVPVHQQLLPVPARPALVHQVLRQVLLRLVLVQPVPAPARHQLVRQAQPVRQLSNLTLVVFFNTYKI